MNLSIASKICNNVVASCIANKFAPVAICVVDAAGHVIATQRMDGCLPSAYPKFAHAKAMTCVSMKMSSRAFRDRYTSSNEPAKFCQMLAMTNITDGQLAPFPGGVLISELLKDTTSSHDNKNSKGVWNPIGAVGVSGAAADEDEFLALQGIWAAFPAIYDQAKKQPALGSSSFCSDPPFHALSLRQGIAYFDQLRP